MSKFQVGDKVRRTEKCYGVHSSKVVGGGIYTVSTVINNDVGLEGISSPGFVDFVEVHFELVERPRTVPFLTSLIEYIMDPDRSVNRSALMASLNHYDVFHSLNEAEERFLDWVETNPLGYCEEGLDRAREALGVKAPEPEEEVFAYTVPLTVYVKATPKNIESLKTNINLAMLDSIRGLEPSEQEFFGIAFSPSGIDGGSNIATYRKIESDYWPGG